YSHNNTLLISGSEKSGKTNALKNLARLYAGSTGGAVYWFGDAGNCSGQEGITVITDHEKMAVTLSELAETAAARKGEKTQEPPIALIIDNLPSVLNELSGEAQNHLISLANDSKSARLAVLAAGEYNELSLIANTQGYLLTPFLGAGATLVTGGALMNQTFLTVGAEISWSEKEAELPDFWGYYTIKGKTKKMKLALYTESGVTARNA
ncbi:MAG: hypothetical protein LBH54_04175, partial [Clostridiales bacterium]|nr:hypothetical protein [Clostridiales bacterium]